MEAPNLDQYVPAVLFTGSVRAVEALYKLHNEWQNYAIELLKDKVELMEELLKLKQNGSTEH